MLIENVYTYITNQVIIPCPVYTNIERDSFLQGYIASHNII
jgi:hypothetical protein